MPSKTTDKRAAAQAVWREMARRSVRMAVTTGLFKSLAPQYRDSGFNPVPIRPGTKSPAPTGWQIGRQEDRIFQLWLEQYGGHGIGLLCGTPLTEPLAGDRDLQGQILIAVDVDRDDMVEPIRHALRVPMSRVCGTRGSKGLSIFARGGADQKNRKLHGAIHNGQRHTLVEILAAGSQTVIPPTVHPTSAPYQWQGTELLQVRPCDLPEIDKAVMEEITAVCESGVRAERFDALRTMTWAGVGGGGNTHDTCVSTVASMVARNWKDTHIHARIEFGKREACLRANLPYDWPASAHVIQEWIDSARRKGMDEVDPKKVPQDRIAAGWLIEQHGGSELCRYMGRNLLHYQDGHWVEVSEPREMERLVLENFRGMNAQRARSAVDTALSLVYKPSFGRAAAGARLVCTRSGTLNCEALVLERWAPEHELLTQARAQYDPESCCPLYERFIQGLFGGDQEKIDLVEEFLGWTFIQDTSYEKAIFIVGRSGIGKSTLTNLLEAMHGEEAVSHVAMDNLGEETWRSNLVGRLVNVSSEKSRIKSISDDYLKKIVSGEAVEVRRYFHDSFAVRLFSRFINTVNEMPDMADYSDGLARRLLIVGCRGAFEPNDQERDTRLLEQLGVERDGIFTRWMRALHRLIQRGGFAVPASVKEEVGRYMEESAGLTFMWLQECCEPTKNPKDYASNDALWNAYNAWTLRHAGSDTSRHTSTITWGKAMKSLGYPAVNARRGHEYIKATGHRPVGLRTARRRPAGPVLPRFGGVSPADEHRMAQPPARENAPA